MTDAERQSQHGHAQPHKPEPLPKAPPPSPESIPEWTRKEK